MTNTDDPTLASLCTAHTPADLLALLEGAAPPRGRPSAAVQLLAHAPAELLDTGVLEWAWQAAGSALDLLLQNQALSGALVEDATERAMRELSSAAPRDVLHGARVLSVLSAADRLALDRPMLDQMRQYVQPPDEPDMCADLRAYTVQGLLPLPGPHTTPEDLWAVVRSPRADDTALTRVLEHERSDAALYLAVARRWEDSARLSLVARHPAALAVPAVRTFLMERGNVTVLPTLADAARGAEVVAVLLRYATLDAAAAAEFMSDFDSASLRDLHPAELEPLLRHRHMAVRLAATRLASRTRGPAAKTAGRGTR